MQDLWKEVYNILQFDVVYCLSSLGGNPDSFAN